MAEETFMRAPAPQPRKTIYTEAMEIFERAADAMGLDKRVRLELEEPDYEHIFYVTTRLKDRLVPVAAGGARSGSATSPPPRCATPTAWSGSPTARSS